MNMLLSFTSPMEFLLRYTVITGIIIAIIGTAMCFTAKRITLAKRKTDFLDKSDRLYVTIMLLGVAFILVGMIVMVLPIENTFYVG